MKKIKALCLMIATFFVWESAFPKATEILTNKTNKTLSVIVYAKATNLSQSAKHPIVIDKQFDIRPNKDSTTLEAPANFCSDNEQIDINYRLTVAGDISVLASPMINIHKIMPCKDFLEQAKKYFVLESLTNTLAVCDFDDAAMCMLAGYYDGKLENEKYILGYTPALDQ